MEKNANDIQVGILIDLGSPFTSEQNVSDTTTQVTVQETPKNENIQEEDDIPLVENEEFDFDLSLSPGAVHIDNDKVDDDEVFFGPVNHREKCVLAQKEIDFVKPLSPLTNEQYAELFKEAIGLVMDLQKDGETVKKSSSDTEEFISLTLEKLKLNTHVQTPPETLFTTANKTTESKFYQREQKKDIRSPRRNTYLVTNNITPVLELPTASECVSRLKVSRNVTFKAKGSVQKIVPKPLIKSKTKTNSLPTHQTLPKKPLVLTKASVSKLATRTSPPKRTRKNSLYSDDGISDTSSITSDMSEASTSSIPIPGRKRTLPISSKLKKLSLPVPASRGSSTYVNAIQIKVPSNKPTLLKPGSFQRRTLIANRSIKIEATTASVQQQPLKATLSLKSTKKSTPTNKPQAGKSLGKTPQSANVKKATPRSTLLSTPAIQVKKVVPKRIMSSTSCFDSKHRTNSSSPCTESKVKATPATPSLSTSSTGSARRRSGIPTPMKSSNKSRVFSFNKMLPSPLPMRMSQSSVFSSSPSPPPSPIPNMPQCTVSQEEHTASPICTHTVVKAAHTKTPLDEDLSVATIVQPLLDSDEPAAPTKAPLDEDLSVATIVLPLLDSDEPAAPTKAPVLIDINDDKVSSVSPKVANLIHFVDTPDTKDLKQNIPADEKENLLVIF